MTTTRFELLDAALDGLAAEHPDVVAVRRDPVFVTRARPARPGKVALVSGGGSGHEPLHTGFVGEGMLDAAVPGAVFASPTANQICAAITAADRGAGVLLIVKNYTGDVLNFEIAAELVDGSGIDVRTVLVDDDLATDSADGPGRRGTAAVIAVEKICGAAAERGDSLDELVALGRRIVAGSRTLGFASRACTHPGSERPTFDLPPGTVEFGVGIHGERGTGRRAAAPIPETVHQLTTPLIEDLGLQPGERVIALVNGLGATHQLELSAARSALGAVLEDGQIEIARSLTGTLVSALDMQGFSITLVRADDELLQLWDAPARTASWRR